MSFRGACVTRFEGKDGRRTTSTLPRKARSAPNCALISDLDSRWRDAKSLQLLKVAQPNLAAQQGQFALPLSRLLACDGLGTEILCEIARPCTKPSLNLHGSIRSVSSKTLLEAVRFASIRSGSKLRHKKVSTRPVICSRAIIVYGGFP